MAEHGLGTNHMGLVVEPCCELNIRTAKREATGGCLKHINWTSVEQAIVHMSAKARGQVMEWLVGPEG